MVRRSTLPLLLGLVASCGESPTPPAADPQSAALGQVMNDVLAKRELPAARLVVVKGDQVVHSKGYGKADLGKPLLFRRRGAAMTLWGGSDDSLGIRVR